MRLIGWRLWLAIFVLGAASVIGWAIMTGDKPSEREEPTEESVISAHAEKGQIRARARQQTGSNVEAPSLSSQTRPGNIIPSDNQQVVEALSMIQIGVKLSQSKQVENVPLELYVRGVLAGEMPADFELEALKAQAIAARTYIVRRLALHTDEPLQVSGTISDQVYIPLKELDRHWGKASKERLEQLSRAVEETAGQILTYDGEPIEALFFSTSNGYTENSEDYFGSVLPYLRSVASPWDVTLSPRYKQTTTMKLTEFYSKLGVKKGAEKKLSVEEYTPGRRIKRIRVGETEYTGRQVRELLGLPSSQFTWRIKGSKIEMTSYGYGHGVGMSQWGAEAMAQNGRRAEEILAHYYSGTRIESATAWLPRLKG